MNVAAGHTLTLDGQAETDHYAIYTTGSQGSQRNYVVNVLDTGAPDDGVDEAAIYGRDTLYGDAGARGHQVRGRRHLPAARRAVDRRARPTDRPAYVALLAGSGGAPVSSALSCAAGNDLDCYRDTITGNEPSTFVQRINYDTALNGRLTVYGRGGNDAFFADDTTAIITLDGGAGNDSFQIGQIFGSKRDVADRRPRGRPTSSRSLIAHDPRLAEPRHAARRWSRRAARATTSSSSTPTRPSCGSRATTATTASSSAPSRSRRCSTAPSCSTPTASPRPRRSASRPRGRSTSAPAAATTRSVQRQRPGLARRRHRLRQGRRARHRVRRRHRHHRQGHLRRGRQRPLREHRGRRGRRPRGRRRVLRPVHGVRRRLPRHRRPRQRHDQRHRRRHRGHRRQGARGPAAARSTTSSPRATRSTTGSPSTASTSTSPRRPAAT